jgi:hypothetical protein
MRYFYRLANPLLCVLEDNLTLFSLSELRKINPGNDFSKIVVFAAKVNDNQQELILFNIADKRVYGTSKKLSDILLMTSMEGMNVIGESFDLYIQSLAKVNLL